MTGKLSGEDERIIQAVETEQGFLSEELHDELCQTLAGIGMQVEVMLRAASKNKSIPLEHFAGLKKTVEQATDYTRALSKKLKPTAGELGGFGLMNMLHELAAEQSRRIACEFKCESPIVIRESRIAHTLFRVAQECCRFDAKDSQLKTIRISLSQKNNCINLEVRYDGKNLPEQKGVQGSELMNARARSVGGEVKVRSEPTHVKILCTIPVPASRLMATKG